MNASLCKADQQVFGESSKGDVQTWVAGGVDLNNGSRTRVLPGNIVLLFNAELFPFTPESTDFIAGFVIFKAISPESGPSAGIN